MQEITEPTVGDVARDVEKGFKNLHLETSDDDDSTLGLITEVVHTPHFLRFKPLEVIIYFQNIFFLYKFWIIARKKVLHFFFRMWNFQMLVHSQKDNYQNQYTPKKTETGSCAERRNPNMLVFYYKRKIYLK